MFLAVIKRQQLHVNGNIVGLVSVCITFVLLMIMGFCFVATCVCPDSYVGDDCNSHECTGDDGVTL